MTGFRISRAPMLIDAQGRPVGFIGEDGQEYYFPRFDQAMQSIVRPDGSALAGTGAGFVLQPATSTALGGVKAGTGVTIGPDGTLTVSVGGAAPTFNALADEALPARSMVYIKSTGRAALADATAEGKEPVGYVSAAVTLGQNATISLPGSIVSGFSGLVPGAPYYLGIVPGTISILASAPAGVGNILMKLGTALSATDLLFHPEMPITL